MSKDLMKLTAVELGKKIKDKEVTVVEATKACLERIKALDETYNCFVTVDEAGALAQAEAVQAIVEAQAEAKVVVKPEVQKPQEINYCF